jgi:hypothetical protein
MFKKCIFAKKKPNLMFNFKNAYMKHKLFLSLLVFLLGCALPIVAQQTVTGTVTDNAADPIIGASVVVKGTSTGSMTDINGNFSLNNLRRVALSLFLI